MARVETIVGNPSEETAPQDDTKPQDDEKRGRSTVQFPYLPLEDVVAVAKGVHEAGGLHCQVDQLAAQLQQKSDSSNFRLKLGTAKMFGLITYGQGTVTLTALGTRISDPEREQAARAEAFLNIPLYKQIYDQYKGANLPPTSGLETAIANMGVAPKQKSNARQVFQRSATQAGFFAYGPNRLVYPPIKGGTAAGINEPPHPPVDHEKPLEKPNGRDGGGDGGDGSQHPFIAGLIKTLPKADSDWPMDGRRKWLQAASHIFELIYKDSDSKGSLRIEVQKDSSK
jgi:hypothetical protein